MWEDRPKVTTSHRHRGVRPDQLEFDLGLACAGELLEMRGEIVAEVYLVQGIVGDVQYEFGGEVEKGCSCHCLARLLMGKLVNGSKSWVGER